MNKLVPILALCLAAAAQSQTVWRCGPDGRSYSDEPCLGGRAVAVADPRTAEQVAAARQTAADEVRRAHTLAQQRQQREAESRERTALAAGIGSDATPPLRPKGLLRKQGPRNQKQQSLHKRQPLPAAAGEAPSPSAVRGSRSARG